VAGVALIASIAAAVVVSAFGGPYWIAAAGVIVAACLAWTRSARENVLWYAGTLALPIPQSFAVIRLSLADLFLLPVILGDTVRMWRKPLPRSTMARPFTLLLVTFVIGTLVEFWHLGRVTVYTLFNKDAGLLFQIAVFFTLIRYARTHTEVDRLARWFAGGMSLANVFALLAVMAARAGFDNWVYLVGNSRLYGWTGNPSINGGLLLTAGMIEIGRLSAPPAAGEHRGLRWIGLWLMALSLGLTLSRSAWLAVASASGALLALLLLDRRLLLVRRAPHVLAVSLWFLLPSLMLANIAAANFGVGFNFAPDDRAAELREQLVGQCVSNPALEICNDVQIPSSALPKRAQRKGATFADRASAAAVVGPLMNARGFNDRLAILNSGIHEYTANVGSLLLGIGLGTFYATSAPDFGVPLIIHNTFAWFLIELGPLGLFVVAWIWWQTAWNLWMAAHGAGDGRFLALGALAAFAGLSAFCLFNEGFYQRQLWLVMVLGDRLRLLEGDRRAQALNTAIPVAQALG
jgi:O-Antigen ligase